MANPKKIHSARSSDILKASRIGDLNMVRSLVTEEPDLVFIKEKQGTVSMGSFLISSWDVTPLHYAAWKEHKSIVEFLLGNKADVNARDSRGYTPLHFAAATGNTDVVALLLASKADVKATTNDGHTPLFIAMSKNQQEVAKLIQEQINSIPHQDSVQTQPTAAQQPEKAPVAPTPNCPDDSCLCCGAPTPEKGKRILCVNEIPEPTIAKSDGASTKWQVTDKKEWSLIMCRQCILSQYEAQLKVELVESKRHFKTSVICLVGSVAFFPIAATGIFKGMGGITNLLALFWTGCLLFGIFGTPGFLYALMKKRRGLVNFRQSGTMSESQMEQVFIKEAEQILKSLESDAPTMGDAMQVRYPLPSRLETHSANRRRIVALS